MSSLNKSIFMGRLTAVPEVKQTQSGKAVCSFTVAVNRTKDITDFIDCVAWQEKAEFIGKHFGKGNLICIVGEINTRMFEDKSHNKRKATEINVREIIFTGEKAQAINEQNSQGNEPADVPNFETVGDNEDLPF